MEETRKLIVRHSNRIYRLFWLAALVFILLTVAAVGGLVYLLAFDGDAQSIIDMFNSISLFSHYDESDIAEFDLRTFAIIVDALFIFSHIMFILFMNLLIKVLKQIRSSETPFTKDNAKRLRRAAFLSVIALLFYNFIIAIVAFPVLMLFSALFEYGAYLQAKADETSRIQEEMIVSFAEITENKAAQTGNHVKRVSEYSQIIARQYGLTEEECERIRLASTMHDIGKLLIPAEILEKPARLTDEEFAVIKKHSGYGGELLEHVEGDIMQLARTIALDHHERPDGRGYPEGKTGDGISIEGRIVAVADVYDALTSRRSYKQAWDPNEAYSEIVKNTGTQFDEGVIEAFKTAYPTIEEARRRYADGKELSFIPA